MYEVLRNIAVGHQGVVELARNDKGELVAIKRMHPGNNADETGIARQRFVREASILAELNLPNVVPLLEVIDDENGLALVMPYLEGGSLHDRVVGSGVLEANELYSLATPLLRALATLHRQGIVHRDIKPANILFDRPGSATEGQSTPYLIDFGIGAATDFTVGLSHTQALLGTPAFMAPERARGEPASAASDIYSLGATLRFALTGMPPHGVGDIATLVQRASRAELEPLPSDTDPELIALLNQMCALAPEDRPSAAQLLAGPFGTWISGSTSGALVAGSAGVGSKPSSADDAGLSTQSTGIKTLLANKKWLLPSTLGLVFLVIAGLSWWLVSGSNPSSPSAEATPNTTVGDLVSSSTTTNPSTTTTEVECVPSPYQGCDDDQPAPNTNGEECLAGFYDHDEDPTNGCEATGDPVNEFRLAAGSVSGTIIPVGDVDKVLVPVTDEWQLFCDGVLTLSLRAPAGLDLEMTVFNRGKEMASLEVGGGSTKSLKIGEPSCFVNDSTTLEVIIRGVRGRSSEPWTLERSGSW